MPPIPTKVRATLYWSGWIIGLVAGSAQVVTATAGEVPRWLIITVGVLLFLQSQVNAMAGMNTRDVNVVAVEAPEDSTVTAQIERPGDDGPQEAPYWSTH